MLPARNAYSRSGTHKTMIVALARKLFIALWQLARHWRASSCVQQAESPEKASPDAYPLIRTYSALALAFKANCRLTIRGGGGRQQTWHKSRRGEWARRPGALARGTER